MQSQATQSYSNQPEPISSVSVLLYHDCVELFLQLVCVYKNIDGKDKDFMSYFDLIQNKGQIVLQGKENMRKLNNIRNNLKHRGLIPGKSEIDGIKYNISDFFQQNTPLVFNRDFSSLSLIQYVKYGPVRKHLEEAGTNISNADYLKTVYSLSM